MENYLPLHRYVVVATEDAQVGSVCVVGMYNKGIFCCSCEIFGNANVTKIRQNEQSRKGSFCYTYTALSNLGVESKGSTKIEPFAVAGTMSGKSGVRTPPNV
jgi:hypothetical protein